MQLTFEIIASNATFCGVIYCSILSASKSMIRNEVTMGLEIKTIECHDDHLDIDRTRSQRLQDYQLVAGLASELKPRLLVTSSIGSILLATR